MALFRCKTQREKGLTHYGVATNMSYSRANFAATTVGNYALFAGGGNIVNRMAMLQPITWTNTVDSYDTSLTHGTPTNMSYNRICLAATTVGNYALFAGGALLNSNNYSNTVNSVDSYDTSLTHGTPTSMRYSRANFAATTVGNYALFAGGSGYLSLDEVDSYDTSLTRGTPTSMRYNRIWFAATTVGNYALFAGSNSSNTVDSYDTSLTHGTPTNMSIRRERFAATTVGNYALFAGGSGNIRIGITVDFYDTSLTHGTPTNMNISRANFAATTVGNYALFAGGDGGNSYYAKGTVDSYDTSLTHGTPARMSYNRGWFAATTVGNYALFAGGDFNTIMNTFYNTVDVYTVL